MYRGKNLPCFKSKVCGETVLGMSAAAGGMIGRTCEASLEHMMTTDQSFLVLRNLGGCGTSSGWGLRGMLWR